MTHLEKLAKADKSNKNRFAPKLTTNAGVLTKNTANAINSSHFNGNKIYAKYYTGSGNHINLVDMSFYIIGILNALKLKYSTGNDAPRGGKNGDFIKVSSKAIQIIRSL
jgi:hypothetical protein